MKVVIIAGTPKKEGLSCAALDAALSASPSQDF